jgi:hypothetical protein
MLVAKNNKRKSLKTSTQQELEAMEKEAKLAEARQKRRQNNKFRVKSGIDLLVGPLKEPIVF